METIYDVLLGGQPVGKVRVEQEGLYYCFSCLCALSGEVIHKLAVTCGEHTENLGVLVPIGREFGLRAKLPIKRLGTGELRFRVLPRHKDLGDSFIPLSPEEPFRYLERLENAFLKIRDGKPGVCLRE